MYQAAEITTPRATVPIWTSRPAASQRDDDLRNGADMINQT